MQITKEEIKEFQEIYKKEFKEEIDEVKAREMARRMLNLFRVIYKPNNQDEPRRKEQRQLKEVSKV